MREQIAELVEELGARRIVRANTGLLEELDLDAKLTHGGASVDVADLRLEDVSAEARIAKPSTTLRDARLLRAGTPRRTATRASPGIQP